MSKFIPVLGTKEKISNAAIADGYTYFETDTGKIFVDVDGERIAFGGGGVSVLYADAKDVKEDTTDFTYMLYASQHLEDIEAIPEKDDLIINSDGRFFKVLSFNKDTDLIKCKVVSVSGTGSGGGTTPDSPGGSSKYTTLKNVGTMPNAQIYIYGQKQNVEFVATATDDTIITITYTITSNTDGQVKSFPFTVKSGETHTFDLGSVLFNGLNTLRVDAIGPNSGAAEPLRYMGINSVSLSLDPSDSFNPLGYAYNDNLTFYCIPTGEIDKTLRVYLNGELAASEFYNRSISGKIQGITIPKQAHGVYKLEAVLSYSTGASEITTEPLKYEVAFVNPEETDPLIWCNNYSNTITEHDKLTLQFMAYDPVSPNNTTIRRFINGTEITPLEELKYSKTDWITWNVSNYKVGENIFILECGSVRKEIVINVEEDLIRDLDIIEAGLYLNLNTLDRSNKENKTSREKWEYKHSDGTVTAVKFNNFNWYNNGWIDDEETGNSILRISNGASIEIPMSIMNLTDLKDSLTFETRFRLRNVQKYENLISIKSEVIGKNEFGEDIVKVTKKVSSTEGVWCKYYNNKIGMCLGTQEGFFTGSNAIASGRYKEDQIVTVSFVIEAKTANNAYPLIYMYIDGVMCSIIEYDKTNESFKSEANAIIINSDYCDVDLLGIRVYKAGLSSSEIVQNYLADKNDAILYDMNQIVSYENGVPTIDYTTMITYNSNHLDQLLQPYAVLECVDKTEDKLPYVKGGKKRVNVTFVNPTLDRAWEEQMANKDKQIITGEEYLCGAPSFYAENIEFDVQGTSSQGYPRRNFKGKFKKKDDNSWIYTNGPLKDKQIGSKNEFNGRDYKGFYMDNTYSETTFTWKADYMESSMTHNTGFASFVNTLYDYHPLKNYDSSIDTTNRRTTIYGFPMMVFQKTAKKNNKGEAIYEFVGRYNFNLDKGCNNVIGFEDETQHPYVEGTFEEDGKIKPLDFAHVAECWELKHNQGGRVAFTKANFAETDENGKLTVLEDFEYRYNYDEDGIDHAIDGTDEWEAKTQAERNAFLLQKYSNLEKVTAWLASTDVIPVSVESYVPVDLPEPVTYGEGEFAVTYTQDTKEYRLAKFQNEFTKHFNTHYCAIYFIMTEFLIQYDSRGKNMMLASWGPQEKDGEYIWYPIFYDIDTQLGVNNSGVPSWEYYDEPTKQGDFSTSSSVLWNNFWTCFSNTIKDTYLNLRKNNLTYEKLNGYYSYDPLYITYRGYDNKNHNSYVMRGHRPINIINVDQYYKYIAPTFSGYINTSGTISKDEARRFYCLQGNRDLHRELFLRNRFNFVDSSWLGGTYSAEGISGEFQIRCNANKYVKDGQYNTSDKYLHRDPVGDEIGVFEKDPTNPLNADWTWSLTPYLRQYVSLRYDKVLQGNPIEYDGDGNPIIITPVADKIEEVKNTSNLTQQLFYIGGAKYISSLGDISLKYPDEIYLTELTRLKDIRLGNDTPNYYNGALTKCALGTSAIDSNGKENVNAKKLLESVVLTGVSSLGGAIDVTGSEKLKEFRALGTNISGVTFADGVQADTIHLPDTVTFLEFNTPVALKNIVEKIEVKEIDEKTGYNIYKPGLYVQGVTDAQKADKTLINKYVINKGNMGYDSYKLLKNLVDIKELMQANTELDTEKYSKNLAISLKEVQWSPYRLVAHGEDVIEGATYALKTDYYTFESYIPDDNWDSNTLNERVYEYDVTVNKNTITDLSILDKFISSFSSKENYFKDIEEYSDNRNTIPTITGDIFINNSSSNLISDSVLKNTYKDIYFPKLNIFVANAKKSYVAKFVEILDNGKEKEWEVLKYEPSETNKINIEAVNNIKPEKNHYDFIGWATTPNANPEDVITDFSQFTFDENHKNYVFYAIYTKHVYTITYYNYDGTTILTTDEKEYNKHLIDPGLIPYKDDSKLSEEQRYAFKGYTTDPNSTEASSENELKNLIKDLPSMVADRDWKFYACYLKESVYDAPTDLKYFKFNQVSFKVQEKSYSGVEIYLDSVYRDQLKGKITMPNTIDSSLVYGWNGAPNKNVPIISLGVIKAPQVTKVFFMNKDNSNYIRVNDNCFNWTGDNLEQHKIQSVYLPNSILSIGVSAFENCGLLKDIIFEDSKIIEIKARAFAIDSLKPIQGGPSLEMNELPLSIQYIGEAAFENQSNIKISKIPSELKVIGPYAFNEAGKNITIIDFGGKLESIGARAFPNGGSNIKENTIIIRNSVKTIGEEAFGVNTSDIIKSQYGEGIIKYVLIEKESYDSVNLGFGEDVEIVYGWKPETEVIA